MPRSMRSPSTPRRSAGGKRCLPATRQVGTGANLTTEVQIAAHAIEHNGEVHSNDGDFARFSGLRWIDPLAEQ